MMRTTKYIHEPSKISQKVPPWPINTGAAHKKLDIRWGFRIRVGRLIIRVYWEKVCGGNRKSKQ